jgi:mRNA-degrading endonuclease RelE of RelBE toxin-antitoxin system
MDQRVIVRWTETAKSQLADLPPKVRRGLLAKAKELTTCADPRSAHKPLVGPLEGFFRIVYSRYRAVYTVRDDQLANGDTLATVEVLFVAAGQRKVHDKKDVYRIAQKLVELGIIQPDKEDDDEAESS